MFNKFVLGSFMTAIICRMADEGEGGYGYGEDEDAKVSPYSFGLNAGNTRLVKFEWKPDAGKDGAEQEALEIIFNINGKDRSYRQFPVTRGFDKNNQPVTDPKAPEFVEARREFESRITHIMHCFVPDAQLKQALAKRIPNFKEYCNVLKGLLPKNTPEIPLDIFMQYQYTLKGDAKRTYLDIPTKRKHGKWLCKAVVPVGKWTMVKVENPEDNIQDAIKFVDDAGNVHPFTRTGWFTNSNFAKQQRADGSTDTGSSSTAESGAAMNAGTTSGSTPPVTTPSTW